MNSRSSVANLNRRSCPPHPDGGAKLSRRDDRCLAFQECRRRGARMVTGERQLRSPGGGGERLHVGVQGVGEHLVGLAVADEHPLVHDGDLVGHRAQLAQVMTDDES